MINTVDDIIASAGVDLLLKDPFYAHLLSSITRLISEKVEVTGMELTESICLYSPWTAFLGF